MRILELLIGDIGKWKKMPLVVKQLKKDLSNRKTLIPLILVSILVFLVVFFSMMGLSYVQNSSQYCTIAVEGYSYGYNALSVPQNENIRYYYKNHKELFEGGYVITCKFDFKRFWSGLW